VPEKTRSTSVGAIAAPATIMNAVMNALAPLGVRHLDMRATPSRIWYAIQVAGVARRQS
jgi:carbon-monoxide dehydrogenase large subunit